VNYAESDDEDDEVFKPIDNGARIGRAAKRRRVVVDEDSDDEFALDEATQRALVEDGRHSLARQV
jgi:DNA mismatch repair protein MSH6